MVRLHTRVDNEAIDLAKERTEMPLAVARLALLVPPARQDLVDDVFGTNRSPGTLWLAADRPGARAGPPRRRVHHGGVKLRGPNGEAAEVIAYRDKLGYDRRVYRLSRRGVLIGEYKTPEELGR